MSWHYTLEKIEKLIDALSKSIVREEKSLDPFLFSRDEQPDTHLTKGQNYEAVSETATLQTTVTVPPDWAGQRVYVALELTGAETLVYIDDVPAQAIDIWHHDVLLAENAEAGRSYKLTLKSYTGSTDTGRVAGWLGALTSDGDKVTVTLKQAGLQWIDRDAEALYFDLLTAVNAAKALGQESRERTTVTEVLDKTVNLLDFRYPVADARFYESVTTARQYIAENLYQKYSADPNFTPIMRSVGHAHIDTAWLWPLAHTRKKIARTFSSQLTYLERYEDTGYVFTCSQPQQYAYIKEDHPEIFARIKEAVRSGRWETVGGMWVESDCNVVSGESLVRQFLFGQRFFKEEFGTHNDVLWLPDVFGYAANIPQIIKKVGMKYFMTIKIYWSQINKPPYQTFEWEGIDGTRVLTHFAPGGDYNAIMTPGQVAGFWDAYKQKNLNDTGLYIFGFGDGGGGPTRKMIETASRLKSFPGMPRVELGTAQSFFETLEKQVKDNPALPRWVGELYLEFHRGTYTSQAKNKNFNRRSEIGLQTAEQLSSVASLLTEGFSYPQSDINKAWQLTLLNQFHDIIPGSSIAEVYEDSTRDYTKILEIVEDSTSRALSTLASSIDAAPGDIVAYNPLPWSRSDVASLPASPGLTGQLVTTLDGDERILVPLTNTVSLGYSVLPKQVVISSETIAPTATESSLENQFYKILLDSNGEIDSILDKRSGTEVVDQSAATKANALLSFEDRPMKYDAWDIDIFYQDKVYPVQTLESIRVVEEGPERASIETVRNFGRGSVITQRISLWRSQGRIDFDSRVEWAERSTLLKVAFPVNVHSARATYDIQFGNVERPTHWNTSWDWARFEVCGHKWADLSEGGEDGYGVALLSESKYGWDIKGNVIRLTLLKGSEHPDQNADVGTQRFAYSLLPHLGDWRSAEVVQRAYEYNVPVAVASLPSGTPKSLAPVYSFASVDTPNIIIETIKKAEDNAAIIIRLYEAYGRRGHAKLHLGSAFKTVIEVNLMEDETDESRAASIESSGQNIKFDYTPYEIKTLKVTF